MKISGTSIFPGMNQVFQKKQLLLGSVAAAKAEKAAKQQEFYHNISALSTEKGASAPQKKDIIIKDKPSYPIFEISKGEIPGMVSESIEQYYQHAGQLADNITYTEERLKFLQSKYEEYEDEGNTSRAEKLKEEIENIYKDMSWLVDGHLGISNAQVQMSERLNGKEFSEELKDQLGETVSQSADIRDSLKGASSLEEALKQLADAKEQVKSMADGLASQYYEYTGKDLAPYEYKTAESYEGMINDDYIIYDTEIAADDSFKVYLKGYDPANDQVREAVNLLDEKA